MRFVTPRSPLAHDNSSKQSGASRPVAPRQSFNAEP